jgi:hypothetical protein
MSAGVTWSGVEELALLLRSLPEAVKAEAAPIVGGAAKVHHALMMAKFPVKDGPGSRRYGPGGNLRRHNTLIQESPLVWRTRNIANHSHLYEKGYTHVSGKVVKGNAVWIPEAQELRERMVSQLGEVVTRVATRGGVLRQA